MNIEKLINQIKLRPEMFVRENYNLTNILNYIYGFQAAKFVYHLQDEVDKAYNDYFFEFVKNEQGILIFNRIYNGKILSVAINLSGKEISIKANKIIFGEGFKTNSQDIILENGGFALF